MKVRTIRFHLAPFRRLLAVAACGLASLLLPPLAADMRAEGANGFYSIHVSTFIRVRDADRELSRLKGHGCEPFHRLESVEGKGEMYRVYVGRYPTRQEAAKGSEQMKEKGFISYAFIKTFQGEETGLHPEAAPEPARPLQPPPSDPAPAPAAATQTARGPADPVKAEDSTNPHQGGTPETSGETPGIAESGGNPVSGTQSFSVHVSTFKGPRDAGREVSRLQGHGCEAFHRLESIEGKGEMYRIYVGRYPTREEARKSSEAMREKGFISYAFIRSFTEEETGPPQLKAAAAAPREDPSGEAVQPPQGPAAAPSPAPAESGSPPPAGDLETASTRPEPPQAAGEESLHSPQEEESTAPWKGPEPAPGPAQDGVSGAGDAPDSPPPADLYPPTAETGTTVEQLSKRSRDILRIPMERRPSKEAVRLSLLDAIRYSIAGNKEMEIASYEPRETREDVGRAEAVYDPVLFFENRQSRGPNIDSTLDNILVEDSTLLKSGVRKPLTTGGTLSLFMQTDYFDTRNELLERSYRYTSAPVVELRQPLLKNLGGVAERSAIRVANISLNISQENFRQTVVETVTRVTQSYWMLYLHGEFMKIERENVRMAEEVYRREFFRMDQGLSKELDVERAGAALEERRGNLLRSEERFRVTMDILKNDLNWSNLNIDSAAEIVPVERPKTLPEEVDEPKAIHNALLNRPEISKTKKSLEIAAIREDLSSHERLPNLDAFARYGLGGYGRELSDSMDEIHSGDRSSWVVGLALEWPIGNRSANALHRRRVLEKRQKAADVERTENQVKREVKEALHGIALAKGEIDSTLRRVESAEKVVEGEFARFDLGQVTNEELLRAQDLLTFARRDFVRAVIDYNISLAELNRAQGIFMEGVEIDRTDASSPS